MNIMRLLSRTSPSAFLVTGAVLALSFPPVRRGLRSVAVLATRGILSVTDQMKNHHEKLKARMDDIVTEARQPGECPVEAATEKIDTLRRTVKGHGRRLAVATAAGVLSVADKAKPLRDDLRSIVDEAKNNLSVKQEIDRVDIHEAENPKTHDE